jgi:hypothetical protein
MNVVKEVTASRIMPPFAVDNSGECHTYRDARWLTDDEIATLGAWADAGAPRGEGVERARAAQLPGLDNPDVVVDMGASYTVLYRDGEDDLRCFLVDPGLDQDRFLTAFEVVPGDAEIVHHMILFAVKDPENIAAIEQRDAESADLGYPCGAGERVGRGATPLSGWAPGVRTVSMPDGVGTRIPAGARIVMQIHYHLHDAEPRSDRTRVKLRLATSVAEETVSGLAGVAGVTFPIEPGNSDAVVTGSRSLSVLRGSGASSIKLYGVFPHMHTRARSMSIWWEPPANDPRADVCVAEVPRYDSPVATHKERRGM